METHLHKIMKNINRRWISKIKKIMIFFLRFNRSDKVSGELKKIHYIGLEKKDTGQMSIICSENNSRGTDFRVDIGAGRRLSNE